MRVEWSVDARRDLAQIAEYISSHNPRAAIEIDALLSSAAAALVDFPNRGRTGRTPGTKETLPHRHYRLVYSVTDDVITILNIVHTARQWPPLAEDDT